MLVWRIINFFFYPCHCKLAWNRSCIPGQTEIFTWQNTWSQKWDFEQSYIPSYTVSIWWYLLECERLQNWKQNALWHEYEREKVVASWISTILWTNSHDRRELGLKHNYHLLWCAMMSKTVYDTLFWSTKTCAIYSGAPYLLNWSFWGRVHALLYGNYGTWYLPSHVWRSCHGKLKSIKSLLKKSDSLFMTYVTSYMKSTGKKISWMTWEDRD